MSTTLSLDLVVDRIEILCQNAGITKSKMLKEVSKINGCEPEKYKSVVDNLKKGSAPTIDKIFMIANYFNCSVDYLLGRTDEPQTKAETKTIEQNHQYIQNDSSFSIGVSLPPETLLDRNQQELLKRYNQLEYEEQIEVMQMIIQKTKKE